MARFPSVKTIKGRLGETDDVLINLGDDLPDGFERFSLVIEVVGPSDPERQAARGRFRRYKEQGHTLSAHDLNQRSGA